MAARVAWYDVKKGWLRDIIIVLHFPYTMWHLAYVVIGAALAPSLNWVALGWTLAAFFLAMGIGAHCLDELQGRPLRTEIPGWVLAIAAVVAIAGAVSIGAAVGVKQTLWVIPCIIFGGFIVFAYNLEWFKGFFHHDFWFGFAWGAFPVVTAYIAQAHTLSWGAVGIALACLIYSLAQRVLSTQVRFFRRKVSALEGRYQVETITARGIQIVEDSGESPTLGFLRSHPNVTAQGKLRTESVSKGMIIEAPEKALKLMTWTVGVAALGLLLRNIV